MTTESVTRKWWQRFFRTPGELRRLGVIGINCRNGRYLLPNNPRKLYRRVDDKIITKELALEQGILVPKTYGVLTNPMEVRSLSKLLEKFDSFVIKPSRGSGGKGIMVIANREGDQFFKPSGTLVTMAEMRHHVSNILAGLYSLGGTRDRALIEYKVDASKVLTDLSFLGAPDVRIVMMHGYPTMAMLRVSTKESDGRSNLHQGAIGIGVDILTGKTVRAIHHGAPIERHPDLKCPLIGVQIPEWDRMLEIATTCYEMTSLGYLGVDVMVDEKAGPMMIEVNARPGLAIQMANGVGLRRRLDPIDQRKREFKCEAAADRIIFSKKNFAHPVASD